MRLVATTKKWKNDGQMMKVRGELGDVRWPRRRESVVLLNSMMPVARLLLPSRVITMPATRAHGHLSSSRCPVDDSRWKTHPLHRHFQARRSLPSCLSPRLHLDCGRFDRWCFPPRQLRLRSARCGRPGVDRRCRLAHHRTQPLLIRMLRRSECPPSTLANVRRR